MLRLQESRVPGDLNGGPDSEAGQYGEEDVGSKDTGADRDARRYVESNRLSRSEADAAQTEAVGLPDGLPQTEFEDGMPNEEDIDSDQTDGEVHPSESFWVCEKRVCEKEGSMPDEVDIDLLLEDGMYIPSGGS